MGTVTNNALLTPRGQQPLAVQAFERLQFGFVSRDRDDPIRPLCSILNKLLERLFCDPIALSASTGPHHRKFAGCNESVDIADAAPQLDGDLG